MGEDRGSGGHHASLRLAFLAPDEEAADPRSNTTTPRTPISSIASSKASPSSDPGFEGGHDDRLDRGDDADHQEGLGDSLRSATVARTAPSSSTRMNTSSSPSSAAATASSVPSSGGRTARSRWRQRQTGRDEEQEPDDGVDQRLPVVHGAVDHEGGAVAGRRGIRHLRSLPHRHGVDAKIPPMVDLTRPLADADDDSIAAAVELGVLPPLLTALAGALDDPSVAPDHLRPDLTVFMDPTYGLSPAQVGGGERAGRRRRIRRLRADPPHEVRALPLDELRGLLAFVTGGGASDDYLELLRDELALGEDLRTPTWRREELAPDRPFRVAVIGAGMSGLVAAHRLNQAGVEVVVLEKNDDVGGTWLENSYPGLPGGRVQPLLLLLLRAARRLAAALLHPGGAPRVLPWRRRPVRTAPPDPLRHRGAVRRARRGDDALEAARAHRRGRGHDRGRRHRQRRRPAQPSEHPRSARRATRSPGPSFHSARWDHDVDLEGKRVVVIGTGASAAQFVPEIAEPAAHLTILQRTPAWFLPTPDYRDDVEPEVAWLLQNVPGYTNWLRFWNFWQNVEGLMVAARVDPEWDDGGASVSQVNELIRQLFAQHLKPSWPSGPTCSRR